MKEIKAIVKTVHGTEEKNFKVVVERNGNLYSPELFDWVFGIEDRLSNMFKVEINGRKYNYSI